MISVRTFELNENNNYFSIWKVTTKTDNGEVAFTTPLLRAEAALPLIVAHGKNGSWVQRRQTAGLVTSQGLLYGANQYKIIYFNPCFYFLGWKSHIVHAVLDLFGHRTRVTTLIEKCQRYAYNQIDWHGKHPIPFYLYKHNFSFAYSYVVSERSAWRRNKGIDNDCRTYEGQPDRDMIEV